MASAAALLDASSAPIELVPPAAPGLDDFMLDGKLASAELRQAITAADIEETMEGASTLTLAINDPDDALLTNAMLAKEVKAQVLGHTYELVRVASRYPMLTLTFEDEAVAAMRKHHSTLKVARSKSTRAEFILRMVREVKDPHIGFHAPELHRRQPIGKVEAAETGAPARAPARGFPKGIELRGKEGVLRAAQLRNAATALDRAAELDANALATKALVEACIVEAPDFKNPTGGHDSSAGILQLLSMHGSLARRRDIRYVVGRFLTHGFTGRGGAIALAKAHPTWKAGQIAQAVQGSAHPGRYDAYSRQAAQIISAYRGGEAATASGSEETRIKRYEFHRGGSGTKEDSWAAAGRLAEEVKWRRFMRRGVLWYVTDKYLIKRGPRMVCGRNSPGVLDIAFEYDSGKPATTATLTMLAAEWVGLPGDRVNLEGLGKAGSGSYLVSSAKRSLFSPSVQIDLTRPTKALSEPAPETETVTTDTGTSSASASGSDWPTALTKMYDKAKAIDKAHYRYVFGGGHGGFSGPYDCSGAVSAVLHAAGLLNTPMATGALASWGQAGKGKYLTVWVKNGGPGGGHTYLEFRLPGESSSRFWGTSGENPGGGAGWHKPRSGGGFSPRHPAGL